MFTVISEPFTLGEKTLRFSKEVIGLCKSEKQTAISTPIIDQLVRSATSIGANYAEANNAVSRSDFRNKIFIAKKEAAETKYWLEVLEDISDDPDECRRLKQECHWLLMTLQKIVNTLNSKPMHSVNSKP